MSWIQGICPFHIIYIRKVANAIGRQADSSMAKTLDKYHGHKAEWRSLLRYIRGSFRFYTSDWWALHSACLLSGYLWHLVVGKEKSLQPETYMQNLLWGWKEQKFRKQVNVKTLQNGVVLSKYTLYTISPFHLLSFVLHKILLRFVYFYLYVWVFCCVCTWALHVCLLLMEFWSRKRIVLLPLAARLLGLSVVFGPRGGQKQGYRWLWVYRRKRKAWKSVTRTACLLG